MTLIRKIVILVFAFLIKSCMLLYPFYGIKEKSPETRDRQLEYLQAIGIDTLNVYSIHCDYLDSLSMKKYALSLYKLEQGSKASAVQFRVYNKGGNLITGWEQCFGGPRFLDYFDKYPMNPKSHLSINKELKFHNDIDLFDISQDKKQAIKEMSFHYDYTVIIFWAEWTGKFNKDAFYNVYDYIENDPDNKEYLVLKLNTSPECLTIESSSVKTD